MRELRYPAGAVSADMLRGLAGVGVCTGVLLGATPPAWVGLGLLAMGGLFASFTLRGLSRARHRFVLEEGGVRAVHRARRLGWPDLERLCLSYYSTRRDRRDGWLELKLQFHGATLRADSRLQGFEALLGAALSAALSNGVELDATTRRNLEWIGMEAATHASGPDSRGAVPDA
jgi:hypothetical protein